MLYEKPLKSFQQIIREASILDVDGGIRADGRYSAKKSLVFMTKSGRGYVLAIYSLKKDGKLRVPDKRLLIKELPSDDELKAILEKVVTKPVKAYSY